MNKEMIERAQRIVDQCQCDEGSLDGHIYKSRYSFAEYMLPVGYANQDEAQTELDTIEVADIVGRSKFILECGSGDIDCNPHDIGELFTVVVESNNIYIVEVTYTTTDDQRVLDDKIDIREQHGRPYDDVRRYQEPASLPYTFNHGSNVEISYEQKSGDPEWYEETSQSV